MNIITRLINKFKGKQTTKMIIQSNENIENKDVKLDELMEQKQLLIIKNKKMKKQQTWVYVQTVYLLTI